MTIWWDVNDYPWHGKHFAASRMASLFVELDGEGFHVFLFKKPF